MAPSAGDPYAAGMETQTAYNYPAFSFALEAQEYGAGCRLARGRANRPRTST